MMKEPAFVSVCGMVVVKNVYVFAANSFRAMLTQPSCGIVSTTLPITFLSFTGLSGALLASPCVMNHNEPPDV